MDNLKSEINNPMAKEKSTMTISNETKSVSRLSKAALVAGASLLMLSACSDDSSSSKKTMEAEDEPTIAEIASGDDRFETLTAALSAAGLVETLQGEGPFTVFAPTDDAFAALPEGSVESLLEDPTGALTDILLYHVVSGEVDAATVVGLTTATTVNGADVAIAVVDGKVILNGNAEVIITDIMASNGIIHVIDAVILPPAE
jgi:uncharacterized surface protein with fasciclin (FAS1) repeats